MRVWLILLIVAVELSALPLNYVSRVSKTRYSQIHLVKGIDMPFSGRCLPIETSIGSGKSLLSLGSSRGGDSASGTYLDRLVQRKKIEVESLLRKHQEPDDPLVMRMSYMASECKFPLANALKRPAADKEGMHTMSVCVDLKRRSPTDPLNRNIVEFSSASKFSELLTLAGADAFFINTDEIEYGGKFSDLKDCVTATKNVKSTSPPPCIYKDVIIHPVQIAQALQQGAAGVLLMVGVVGGDLETLLDACTIMGTEAICEVHTPNELEFALSKGATLFLVNMWDRMSGKLYMEQAKGLASMLPVNTIAMVAGNIHTVEQVMELGFYGYDSVVLGRGITTVPDIKVFLDDVHSFKGPPRSFGMGFKGLPWAGA